MNKICQICKLEKSIDEFGTDNSKKDGKLIYCKLCHRQKQLQYYNTNSEKCRLRTKLYRELHKTDPLFKKRKSDQDKQYRKNNIQKIQTRLLETRDDRLKKRREYRKINHQENPEKYLLEASKYRAYKKGLEHTLTLDDIQIPTHCPILGIPLIVGVGKPSDNSPSIDRIDNTRGYTKNNILVISWKANDLKGRATIEELQKIVDFYKKL